MPEPGRFRADAARTTSDAASRPDARSSWRPRRADVAVGAFAAGSLLACAIAVSGALGPDLGQAVSDASILPMGFVTVALALLAGRRFPRASGARRAWWALAAAFLCTAIGDSIWFVLEALLRQPASPSIGDVVYLGFYPALLVAVLAYPTPPRTRSQRLQAILDTIVVVASGALVVWYVLLRPLASAGAADALTAIFAVAYPAGDLVLLFVVGRLGARRPGGLAPAALAALLTSLVLMFAADIAYGMLALEADYAGGNWPDVLYAGSWVAALATGYLQLRSATRPSSVVAANVGRSAAFDPLPYLFVALAAALTVAMTWGQLGEALDVLVAGCFAVTGLVVVRQLIGIREQGRLYLERALATGEAHFRSLVQNSTDLITVVDADTTIRYQTPSAEALLGISADELLGTRLVDLVHPDDAGRLMSLVSEAITVSGITPTVELRLRNREGSWVFVETIGANQLADPNLQGVVLNTRDLRERKALEAELTHRAFHDPLTNLANRALFLDRVEHALARARRSGRGLAVLFLDLDNFKTINDSLGHAAGDQVLVECAGRLRSCLRLVDTPARFGGDEFAVLLEDVFDSRAASIVAEHIEEALRVPFVVDGQDVFLSASVGIAASASGDDTAAELLRNADVAMYTAKEHGKGRAELYVPEMHAAVLARLELEAQLRRAIERSELVVHYQPIVHLRTRRTVGFEALVRWNHPTRGLLLPEEFLPLAEETGLIVPLGGWVLDKACHVLHELQQAHPGATPLSMSVNVSGRQLQAAGLVDEVAMALDRSGIQPRSLTLEVTETVLVEDAVVVARRLRELRSIGVRVAIDDFGTGYSSLSYLRDFPVDMVKIDRSFIENVASAAGQRAITRSIVELGRAMHFQTVAEGIEQDAQLKRLSELGCELGQGCHFARPLASSELGALLDAEARGPSPTREKRRAPRLTTVPAPRRVGPTEA